MGSHDPYGHLKHKLWPKEGLGVKLVVWLSITKSQELTQFPCTKVTCDTLLKSSQRGPQLCFKPHFNRRSEGKVMGPRIAEVPILGISGLPFESLGTKCYLDVGLVEKHRVYYMGEGDGFSQVQAVVSLVSPSLPVACFSTKSAPTMH
jgi:hypothetical protein